MTLLTNWFRTSRSFRHSGRRSKPFDKTTNEIDLPTKELPAYLRLQGETPVAPLDGTADWHALSHAAAADILGDSQSFSSRCQMDIDPVLLGADPPNHDLPRRLLSLHLMPKAGIALTSAPAVSASLLTPRLDIVGGYAAPLSRWFGAEILGMSAVPFADILSSVTNSRANENLRSPDQSELARSSELYRTLRGEMGDDEAVSLVVLVASAATETVERLIARCVIVLLRDDGLRRELIEHSERLAPFIEEVLRLYPPEPTLVRETTGDVVLNKCLIPSGTTLKVSVAAANRDSAFYHDPHRILLDRRERHHYSFGAGVHQCIGAGFARKLCRIALVTLLERAPGFTSEIPVQRIPVMDVGGRLLPQQLWINLAQPKRGVGSSLSLDS